MLKRLKEMQKQGIFSLLPYKAELDSKIEKATDLNQLANKLEDIKNYIKQLDEEFSVKYHVSIANKMSDFYDKIYYTLYEMYLKPQNTKTKIYEANDNYGKAGKFKIGLSSSNDVRFTLEERKLIKLINHYYISLKGEDKLDNDLFYIPTNQIQRLYSDGKNANRLKQSIIETCNNLNSKVIYLDFSATRYKQKLSKEKLTTIEGEQFLNVIPIYQIWGNDDKIQLKGIICKVNNFMKLRYELKQISNNYPVSNLNSNYLEFVISDKLQYYLHLIRKSKTGNKVLKKGISDLAKEVFYYGKDKQDEIQEEKQENKQKKKQKKEQEEKQKKEQEEKQKKEQEEKQKSKQQSKSYYEAITNDKHKPREQNKFLTALLNISSTLEKLNYSVKFEIDGFAIPATRPNGESRELEHVLTEITKSGEKENVARVYELFGKLSSDIAPISIQRILKQSKLIPEAKLGEYENKLYKNKVAVEKYKQNSDILKYDASLCEYERILEEMKNELISNIYSVGTTRNFLKLFKRGEISIIVKAK